MHTYPPLSRWLLAALFVVSGLLHFAFPGAYVRIVPAFLPAAPLLVLISGVAEVLGGIGLLLDRTRRLAGIGLILLLLAVWPANVQMLLEARESGVSPASELLLWLRIPLQLLLIFWVWRVARMRA